MDSIPCSRIQDGKIYNWHRAKQTPPLLVADEASAAARVQVETEALLWVDTAFQSIYLTERWESGTVCRKLPFDLCVSGHEAAVQGSHLACPGAAVAFAKRSSADLCGRLALTLLPEWLSIRQSTATKSLLLLTDHWIVSEQEQSVRLQHPEGQLDVLLQLDVCQGGIAAMFVQQGQPSRSFLVSCFGDVIKLLKKHSKPCQRLDKVVHTVLQDLKPTAASAGRLLARLEAAVMGHKGAPSLAQWCRGGIVAALVDAAVSLGSSTGGSCSSDPVTTGAHCKTSSGGGAYLSQQQHRGSSMPGAPPETQSSSTSGVATLQALSECCTVVLQFHTQAAEQAGLLVAGVRRALTGSLRQALWALQLLRMVLRQVGTARTSAGCLQLHQACGNPRLLHQMLHCFGNTIAEQQLQYTGSGQVMSHQLEGLSPDGASEPTTPQGRQAVAATLCDPERQQGDAEILDCSTTTPRSPVGNFLKRQLVVPKLHLPVPATPAASSACRLSLESPAQAAGSSTSSAAESTDRATALGCEVGSTSFVKALQQLGYSCGQSVMAADLAAFVTHKQLLGGAVSVEAGLQHCRQSSPGLLGASPDEGPGQNKLRFEQLQQLPLPAQLQLELLEVLVMLVVVSGREMVPLTRSWEHVLLAPLLWLPSPWLQHGSIGSGAIAGREYSPHHLAYQRMRALTLKLTQSYSCSWHNGPASNGCAGTDALTPSATGTRLQHTVLEQFKARLVAQSRQQTPVSPSMHGECAELLLLLRDYLQASRQPQLADTACFMLGGVLAQQEHCLRQVQLKHWSIGALLHMDALIQLYTQLLNQVVSPAAASWLLTVLGVHTGTARLGPSPAAGISCSTGMNSLAPRVPVPADTLQLVLDVLQMQLANMSAAADGSGSGSSSHVTPAAATLAVCGPVSPACGGCGSCSSCDGSAAVCGPDSSTSMLLKSATFAAAVQQSTSTPCSTGTLVVQLQANCWTLLSSVMLLAACHPAAQPPEPPGSTLALLDAGRSQPQYSPGSNMTPGRRGSFCETSSPNRGLRRGLSARSDAAAAGPVTTPGSSRRPSVPLLALPNSGSSSRPPSVRALTAGRDGGDVSSCQWTNLGRSASSRRLNSSAPGCCNIWQVLVELMMVNGSAGQAVVLQHMAKTHGNRLLQPLQQAVVGFLSTALGTPDSYAFSKPQLAEFYVHHHFLHFTQHYHKLPASPASGSAVLCRSHLQVLLALCRQTGGAYQVRRRFLQLKVLEFLAREASLEYMCHHNQLAASPGSSSCSTPLSTSRTAASCRVSARGSTDPGWAGAAAGPAPAAAGWELGMPPNPAVGMLPASAGNGCSLQDSTLGGSSSRLWVSSPGCQGRSARSIHTTPRSLQYRVAHGSTGRAARPQQLDSSAMSHTAAVQSPLSFELQTISAEGTNVLLTGTSGLLKNTSSLPGDGCTAHSERSSIDGAGGTGLATGQHLHQTPKLGSKIKAAVEALESAAAAVRPQLRPQPQPTKVAAPSAAAGRRQPGHQRLVCASDNAPVAPPALNSSPSRRPAHQPSTPQAREQSAGTSQAVTATPQIPKLKLPTTSSGPGSSCRQSPMQRSGTVAGGQLTNNSASLDSSSSSSSQDAASPRADILGFEVPASLLSQRRVKQPKLTGDASFDNIIIDNWELETGLDFQFDGLSEGSEGGSESDRSSISSSVEVQDSNGFINAAPGSCEQAVSGRASPGLSVPAGDCLAATAVISGAQLDFAGPGRAGRWISSTDSVEEAPIANVAQILAESELAISGQRGVGQYGKSSICAHALAAADSPAASRCQDGGKLVPQLWVGGHAPAGPCGSRAADGAAAVSASGTAGGRGYLQSPGTYRPGFDLEDDFERLMAAGDWEDSETGSEAGAQAQASSGSLSPCSPHRQGHLDQALPCAALQHSRPKLPGLQLPQQPCKLPADVRPDPASPGQVVASADIEAAADVHTSKRKQHKHGKQQVVVGHTGSQLAASPHAHALACVSGSSTEEEGPSDSSSDSELGSSNGSLAAGMLLCRTSPSCPQGVVIPRLNLPQLQQPSWHLPMADAALLTGRSSKAGLGTTYRTDSSTGSRGNAAATLQVVPLTTSRLSCGGAGSSHGFGRIVEGCPATTPQLSDVLGADCTRRWSSQLCARTGSTRAVGNAEYSTCAPWTPGAPGASQGAYAAHRLRCSVYVDLELHVLCLELALHLLVTPDGQLDPVQLPHEPSDISLQRKVLLLLEHLSHPANLDAALALAQRARAALREQQRQHQCPLPLRECSEVLLDGPQQDAPVRSLRAVCDRTQGDSSRVGHLLAQESMHTCSKGLRNAATAAAGLADGTLRLLKLMCLHVLDPSSLTVGGMINKGAFSEVLEGTFCVGSDGRPVAAAFKVMDCTEDDACSFERVYNEVASLEFLRGQPSVVPLLDYGVTTSISGVRQWVLIFPRYAGSMREWRVSWAGRGLNSNDLPVYLSLFLQVARAVAVLHAHNVVHFDIKGDNVLLQHGFDPACGQHSSSSPSASSGSSSRSGSDVVLADFGDALVLEDAHASSQRHRGTELFSSPEMLLLHAGRQHTQHAQHDRRKHRGVHAAHDVWSLGCTLYELLTGTVLFEEEGVGRITSYSSTQSSGGGAHSLRPDAGGWGVLNDRERAALQHNSCCIELVESMLVGEPNWRPTADQVIMKTQRLLASVLVQGRPG